MLGSAAELTRGRLLARNVGLNLAGWVLPAVAALVAIPRLLHGMGAERFGLLTLAWTLVGYFSAFDLGVGRALTQALAERVGDGDEVESPQLTWTALWLLVPVGVGCAVALALLAPRAASALRVSPALRTEVTAAVRLVAAAVPFMVLTAGLRGALEAGQRFKVITALRIPLGLLTFLGPLATQAFTPALAPAVGVLVVGRAVLCGLHGLAVVRAYPALARVRPPRRRDAARLWRVAGWMTVSGMLSPVLVSADRFVIGAVLPVAAVAHYASASEITSRLSLFTAALHPVLFPALAATIVSAPERAALLFDRAVRATAIALAPVAMIVVLLAPEGLTLWLGADAAREGAPLVRWLTIAVFVNAIANVPYAVLQGGGRADLAGKLHALEIPLYLAALWFLLARFGLEGVAAAWLLRMFGDALAQLALTARVLPAARVPAWRAARLVVGGAALLALCAVPASRTVRGALGAAGVAAFLALAPRVLLTDAERAQARGWARSARRAAASA